MSWHIELQECNPSTRTARWKPYRHRHGTKPIAQFPSLWKLRAFAKRHALALGYPCRAVEPDKGLKVPLNPF